MKYSHHYILQKVHIIVIYRDILYYCKGRQFRDNPTQKQEPVVPVLWNKKLETRAGLHLQRYIFCLSCDTLMPMRHITAFLVCIHFSDATHLNFLYLINLCAWAVIVDDWKLFPNKISKNQFPRNFHILLYNCLSIYSKKNHFIFGFPIWPWLHWLISVCLHINICSSEYTKYMAHLKW